MRILPMKRILFILFGCLLLTLPVASAADPEELTVFGLEAEKLLSLGSCAVALVLAALTFAAYRTTGKRRLLYVSAAFLLFGVRAFLIGAEIFFGEWLWVDPVANILDFVILATFFIGIMRK